MIPRKPKSIAESLRKILPADATVTPPAARDKEMATMLGAFQLNLTAMSLVSIVVGMFLIFNSVGATMVRRRTEIAVLRACGATRLQSAGAFPRRRCDGRGLPARPSASPWRHCWLDSLRRRWRQASRRSTM